MKNVKIFFKLHGRKLFAFLSMFLVLSALIVVPSFAFGDESTQGDFLYENRNKDYLLGELKGISSYGSLPVADLSLTMSNLARPLPTTHPSDKSGYFTNPFLSANYATIVYTNEAGLRTMLPIGKVDLSYTLEGVDELGEKFYAYYYLLYSVWSGDVATETYRIKYSWDYDNPKGTHLSEWYNDELGVLENPELLIFMGGSDIQYITLPIYENAIVNASSFGVSYPYLIGNQYQYGYDKGYQSGESDGYFRGKQDGYNEGILVDNEQAYNEGYYNGQQDIDSGTWGENLLGHTLSAPIRALNQFTLVTTPSGFNITLGLVVGCAIALTLFIAFLKLFAGG